MSFRFEPLEIPGVVLVRPEIHRDDRGFLYESYRKSAFREAGLEAEFCQDNHSRSRRGVLRGLHYQRPPRAHAKLVRAVEGEIFDVAVDLRRDSPSYGDWVAAILSADNRRMLFVPEGFAHGYCVLSAAAAVHYKITAEYAPEHEGGVVWDDPDVGIEWPIEDPILSERDAALPPLRDAEPDFEMPTTEEAG